MKFKTVFLLLAIILLSIQHAKATAPLAMPLNKMNDAADQILRMTKMNHYDEAKLLLTSFSNEYSKDKSHSNLFTQDELRTLRLTQEQALRAISNNKVQLQEKLKDVTAFRLVVDALNSKYQPLWTEMKQPIMTAFNGVRQAARNGNYNDYQTNLNTFLHEYSIIEPSLMVDIPTDELQKLNAKISFLDKYRISMLKNSAQQVELEKLNNNLEYVFDEMSRDETDPSLWWVIFTTGSIIIFTLSYVGIRKYYGQKHDKARKEHND